MNFNEHGMTPFWGALRTHGWQQIGGTYRFHKVGSSLTVDGIITNGILDKNLTFKKLTGIEPERMDDMTTAAKKSEPTKSTKATDKKMVSVPSEITKTDRCWVRFKLTNEEVEKVDKVRVMQGFTYNATLAKQVFMAFVDDCIKNPPTKDTDSK